MNRLVGIRACAAPTALRLFAGNTQPLTDWANLWRTSGALEKALEKEEDRILEELGIVVSEELLESGGGGGVLGGGCLGRDGKVGGPYLPGGDERGGAGPLGGGDAPGD